jgi:hypothetical protein
MCSVIVLSWDSGSGLGRGWSWWFLISVSDLFLNWSFAKVLLPSAIMGFVRKANIGFSLSINLRSILKRTVRSKSKSLISHQLIETSPAPLTQSKAIIFL